jgi:arylsulfatase A-like enzyme
MITHSNKPRWRELQGDVAVGALFSVAAALADLLRGVSGGPPGLGSAVAAAACLGAIGICVFLIYLGALGIVFTITAALRRSPKRYPLSRRPLTVATGFFAAGFALAVAPGGAPWNQMPLFSSGRPLLPLALCLLSSVGVYALANLPVGPAADSRRTNVLWLCPLALLTAAAALRWWSTYQSGGQLAPAGLGIAAGILALLLGLAAARCWTKAIFRIVGAVVVLIAAAAGWQWVGAAGSGPASAALEPAPGAPAHIILVTIDTLRADVLGRRDAAGELIAPHLSGWASQAVAFTQAIAPAPWTLPSLASLMTGFGPFVHGAKTFDARLPEALPTLAERLGGQGYYTGAIGYNPFFEPRHGLARGFRDTRLFPPPALGDSAGAGLLQRHVPQFRPEITTTGITAEALRWIERRREGPFFLWVHYYDPHLPYAPPEAFAPAGEPQPAVGLRFERPEDAHADGRMLNHQERQAVRALYDAEARYVDAGFGEILAQLRNLGLYERSLLVVTSDHGEEFWEHSGLAHGRTLYNEVLQVPLLVKAPRAEVARTVDSFVSTASVMPTLLDLAGVEYETDPLMAPSLLPFLDGNGDHLHGNSEQAAGWPAIVSTAVAQYEDRVAVILEGKKYIRSLVGEREELYDLAADPEERSDIKAASPADVASAQQALQQHLAGVASTRQRFGVGDQPQAVYLETQRLEFLKSLGYVHGSR